MGPNEQGTDVSVRLLGPIQLVHHGGEIVDLPSPSQRRLVAMLGLSAGRTLRTEFLSEQLGVSPGALRKTVARLRNYLGSNVLQTHASGYRFDGPVDARKFVDEVTAATTSTSTVVAALAALDIALARWVGPALDEFSHESWAEAEAVRLQELHALAIEHRSELLLSNGRGSEAVAALHAHIAEHPTRDRARGLLLRALAVDGRQADALRAYQSYRRYLAEELGTAPSLAVVGIEQRIAAGWIGVDDPKVSAARTTVAPFVLHGALAQGATLLGRQRQHLALQADAAKAKTGVLRTVAITGEAGIGKTTLLGAFGRWLHDGGASVIYGRCDEAVSVPLLPFQSIVTQLFDAAPADLRTAHRTSFGDALAHLVPALDDRLAAQDGNTRQWVDASAATADASRRYELFEATVDLIGRTADRLADERRGPLTLIIDDLHWAEPTALLLLRHLVRSSVDHSLLVIVSYRDSGERKSDELRATLADLDRIANRRVPLVGFDDAELAELIAFMTSGSTVEHHTGLVAHLSNETGGNPLYATQLVAHLVESGARGWIEDRDMSGEVEGVAAMAEGDVPPSLRDIIWSRVRAIGAMASEVLGAASVLGVEFRHDLLAHMIDLDDDSVAAVLDGAVDAGLLVERGGGAQTLRFAHALVAHALYSDLRGRTRSQLHERAATTLLKHADVASHKTIVELARHSEMAGRLTDAQHWAAAAGDSALEHLAAIEASRWFSSALDHARALNEPPAVIAHRLLRLGEAQHRAGDQQARSTVLEAATIARRCGADDVVVRAALADDREMMLVGSVDVERLESVEAALAVCDHADTDTYARLLARFARELIHTPRNAERQEAATKAIAIAETSGDPNLLTHVARALLLALWAPDTLALRCRLVRRSAEAADRTNDPFLQFRAHHAAFVVAIESADAPAARRAKARIEALASRMNEPRLHWMNALVNSFEATMGARISEGDEAAARAFALATEMGDADAFTIYATQIFVSHTFAGRHLELFDLIAQAKEANPEIIAFQLAYAIIAAAAGRTDEAQAVLDAGARDGFAHIANDYLWKTTIIGFAIVAIELSDARAAGLLYPILEPFGREVAFNGITSQGYIGAYLGKLASLLGNHDTADEHLLAALTVADEFGWEYHRATTLVALVLSRVRRLGTLDEEASGWLRQATGICETFGLKLITSQIAMIEATGTNRAS